jgi:hypothetical protein
MKPYSQVRPTPVIVRAVARVPLRRALLEWSVSQLPNVSSIRTHSVDVTIRLRIAWVQRGFVLNSTSFARENEPFTIPIRKTDVAGAVSEV